MEKKQISTRTHPHNKPIDRCIYITEQSKGVYFYKVKYTRNKVDYYRIFETLQEAVRYRDELDFLKQQNKSIVKRRRKPEQLNIEAEIIETFVIKNKTLKELSKKYNISQNTVSSILQQYYKPQDGVEIIIQSKINGIEHPDKIKNITFL